MAHDWQDYVKNSGGDLKAAKKAYDAGRPPSSLKGKSGGRSSGNLPIRLRGDHEVKEPGRKVGSQQFDSDGNPIESGEAA